MAEVSTSLSDTRFWFLGGLGQGDVFSLTDYVDRVEGKETVYLYTRLPGWWRR